MMRGLLFLLSFFILLVVPTSYAADLAIDLAEQRVDITTGFTGDDLVLFGTKTKGSSVVIKVEGPPKEMVVRRKDRVLGVWMNNKSVTFQDVPGYYNFAVSDQDVLTQEDVMKLVPENFMFETKGRVKEKHKTVFMKALVRNKQAQKLFPDNTKEITFLTDEFFRARFHLPPNVPMGDYKITTYLVKDDKILSDKSMIVNVEQIGMSATINHFARDRSLFYGVLCVIFSVVVGWGAYILRQRIR